MSKSIKASKSTAPKARGPKAGSAQSNQSVTGVKATPRANADRIMSSVAATGGNGWVLIGGDDKSLVIAPWQDNAATRKLAIVGGSMRAVREHIATISKPDAKLARGVDSHNAPHSAKAMADQRNAKASAKTDKPAATGKGKARTTKAAANKQPSKGLDRKYKNAGRKDESKPDTFRRYMLTTIMSHKNTAAAKEAHKASGQYPTHKLDFNWAAQQGYIAFTDAK